MTKRFGFTLAEVLITLGIIGVVAAMTIPTLIANTNSAKFRAQFKKSLSTLNQAGLMAQAQYDFDYAGTDEACSTTVTDAAKENPEGKMTFCSLLNGTLTGQTYVGAPSNLKRANSGNAGGKDGNGAGATVYSIKGYATSLGATPSMADYLAYQLSDGSIVAFPKGAKGCTLNLGEVVNSTTLGAGGSLAGCIGFIDVNGTTLPNKEVACGADGKTFTATKAVQTPCTVKNDAKHMTDVFPVVFHDATVEPASDAAKYVLTSSK